MGVWDAFQVAVLALQLEHEAAIDRGLRAGAGIVIR